MSSTARIEYRVVWKRLGQPRKTRPYVTRGKALRFMELFGSEPWKAFGKTDGDARVCCSGRECGCGGMTWREHMASKRKELPPLEYVRLEWRAVGEFRPMTEGRDAG